MTTGTNDLPPPPPPRGDTTTLINKSAKGVLCAKCNHLNKPRSTKCSVCGSHLHIKCNDCGARNERFYSQCQECGRRLHKPTVERMQRTVFNQASKITLPQIALLIGVVALIVLLAVALNHVRLPKL